MSPKYSKLTLASTFKQSSGNHAKKAPKKAVKKSSSASKTNGTQKKEKLKKKILQVQRRSVGVVKNFIVV
jgi:hypothetical protein